MIWVALLNNISEAILGLVWSCLVFYGGFRFGKWRGRRNTVLD